MYIDVFAVYGDITSHKHGILYTAGNYVSNNGWGCTRSAGELLDNEHRAAPLRSAKQREVSVLTGQVKGCRLAGQPEALKLLLRESDKKKKPRKFAVLIYSLA